MLAEEILLVNDGSVLLKMIGGLLESKGYPLHLTDSPEKALELLSSRNIKLVVMKMNGSHTNRLAVGHMVKELNGGAKLIIMGEASHLPADIFEMEADDYVLLPCRFAEIWRRLGAALQAEPPPRQTVEPLEEDLPHPVNRRVLYNLGIMFHDLRGLITSVDEGLKTLRRRTHGRLADELEGVFQDTFRKNRTLVSVADEFLQKFQGRSTVQPSHNLVDLREDVVAPILAELQVEIQNKGITLDDRLASLPPGRQIIRGDRVALKSIFRNLLNNAITHGGAGCTICIDGDEAPEHFRLQVQNTGAQLPPHHQEKLFSGRQRPRDPGRRVGLGLYLGRQLMRSHGGDISCEPGRLGPNFILTLPRAHF
jgi:signal transduction histidine kinase